METHEPKQEKGKNLHKLEDKCHMCGMHVHWSLTCRTPKHLIDLYQASLKQNAIEINFIHKDDFEGQYLSWCFCFIWKPR
jgi:hypothetical protein